MARARVNLTTPQERAAAKALRDQRRESHNVSHGGMFDLYFDDAKLTRAIQRIRMRTADLRPFWVEFRDELLDAQKEWFAGHGGGKWSHYVSPRYAKWKAAHGGGDVLVQQSVLIASLTKKRGKWQVYRTRPTEMVFGTREVSALMADRGARGVQKKSALITDQSMILKHLEVAAQRVAVKFEKELV
jgi:hypothetical protein